jgi:small GTP-binding protein
MNYQKKICVIGEFGVGKTSLISQYVRSIFSEKYHTTIGVKIDKKQVAVDDSEVTLIIWDIAGESEFGSMKPNYLAGASGYLLVADGTRPGTIDAAMSLQQRVSSILGPVPFILALNKADLTERWAVGPGSLDTLKLTGWDVRSSSAKTGDGVEDIFLELSRRLIQGVGDCHAPR